MDSENRLHNELAELSLLLQGLSRIPAFPAELLELLSRKVEVVSQLVFQSATLSKDANFAESAQVGPDDPDQAEPVSIPAPTEKNKNIEVPVLQTESSLVEPAGPLVEPSEQQFLTDLSQFLTLNDRFRFQREFFDNDPQKMTAVLAAISRAKTVDEALELLQRTCTVDTVSDSYRDFCSMLDRHFTGALNLSQSY